MRLRLLALLSILLLALQVILGKGVKETRTSHISKAKTEEMKTPNKTQVAHGSQSQKRLPKGQFVSPNRAVCRWAVTEQEKGIALKVACAQEFTRFSCVFTGNPNACLELNHRKTYWKQIRRNLRSQKAICEDDQSALEAQVCRKNFPASSLKLVNSTLIRNKPSRQEHRASSPRKQTTVNESTPSKAAETQPGATKDPQCMEDPDLVTQRKVALEYCGEAWSSLCHFFIAMFQGSSC
ncbi:fibroblast growth factor-binding protein 1 [Sorex fumeus]|uniref:fibroblast growth factor-binding protein 1 n=1 Tax=Sorex fumeus TaxID=62283 RepID=UPI0024AE5999|nr:fibroblast growth factor-binding protein 1 [Sorex fumeus]